MKEEPDDEAFSDYSVSRLIDFDIGIGCFLPVCADLGGFCRMTLIMRL